MSSLTNELARAVAAQQRPKPRRSTASSRIEDRRSSGQRARERAKIGAAEMLPVDPAEMRRRALLRRLNETVVRRAGSAPPGGSMYPPGYSDPRKLTTPTGALIPVDQASDYYWGAKIPVAGRNP